MPSISDTPLISGQNASDEPVGVKGLREVFGNEGEGWKVTVFEKTPKVSVDISCLFFDTLRIMVTTGFKLSCCVCEWAFRTDRWDVYEPVEREETSPSCVWCVLPFPEFHAPHQLPPFCTATPDIIHQGHFALEVKSKTLPLYEQVFDVEFPLPKLDTLVVRSLVPLSFRFLHHTDLGDASRQQTSMQVQWRTGV
jgi:hypothetical protein